MPHNRHFPETAGYRVRRKIMGAPTRRMLPPAQGRAIEKNAVRTARLDYRNSARAISDTRERQSCRTRFSAWLDQDQSTRELGGTRNLAVRQGQRCSVQPVT